MLPATISYAPESIPDSGIQDRVYPQPSQALDRGRELNIEKVELKVDDWGKIAMRNAEWKEQFVGQALPRESGWEREFSTCFGLLSWSIVCLFSVLSLTYHFPHLPLLTLPSLLLLYHDKIVHTTNTYTHKSNPTHSPR